LYADAGDDEDGADPSRTRGGSVASDSPIMTGSAGGSTAEA
jgi:hypothetical protein